MFLLDIYRIPRDKYEFIDNINALAFLRKADVYTDIIILKTKIGTSNFLGLVKKSFFNTLLGIKR